MARTPSRSSEAAVLAGLMKAPSKLAPDRNPEGATERAAQVITAMAQEGHITESMAKTALSHVRHAPRSDIGAGSINYAADYVMDMLDDTIGAIDQDIVVTTTIDARLQDGGGRRAQPTSSTRRAPNSASSQGALVALDPNGAIRALVGGRDYSDSQFNRAVSAKRQPGSAFKPFVYLAGLEHGLTPDTVREDGPINVKGWQPENYSHRIFRPRHAHQGAVAVAQHGRRARRPRSRAQGRGRRPRIASASSPSCRPTPRSRSARRR